MSESELRRELTELAREASHTLRRGRRRGAAARALDTTLPFLPVVPAAWLMLLIAANIGGGGLQGVPWWSIALVTLAVPTLTFTGMVLAATWRRVERRDALSLLDRELGLEDRLLTADELLEGEAASPFVAAALEDALAVAPKARGATLPRRGVRWRLRRHELALALLAVFLLVVTAWIPTPARLDARMGEAGDAPTTNLAALETVDNPETPLLPPAEPRPGAEAERTPVPPRAGNPAVARRDEATKLSDEVKESVGLTREGLSSDAESRSGASQSRGLPSNQSQVSKPADKPPKKDGKKVKPRPPAKLEENPRRNQEEDSGSTAGKGSSKGSNRNPVVSRWSSKDQVTTDDDQEIEEDEDAEDEEEDQEARGGVQPNLRDRKPPVSRDLRIGFGNRPNPDANGRGGPSEMKNSRGTASLVLGVPIPDRVKGQPNPGKTKITQERIEPSREESEAIDAEARRAREAPVGHLVRRDLAPWMRTLVREYFLTQRQRTDGS